MTACVSVGSANVSLPSRGAWIETGVGSNNRANCSSRSPHGGRGLKPKSNDKTQDSIDGRSPHGGRGLKHIYQKPPRPRSVVAPLTGGVD